MKGSTGMLGVGSDAGQRGFGGGDGGDGVQVGAELIRLDGTEVTDVVEPLADQDLDRRLSGDVEQVEQDVDQRPCESST